ncbi:phenylacetate-CoA ligase [Paenibacillus cellulosilyticus]|uniref:Phenylacetate-CoA ligase n=1 Tax=Paenibacillus cellulosilyticus TaxID=375489 RepID=A0A2V2YGN1_9BACL|nr:CoF synthetase [Paenibacillus cellulosilyticus]PWV92043.1 phenylacetate-CoA ligase [Paenibacillus cellulosilyticus]QKS46725.1 CoF synthetase [Paenibacillus cellulosilyticus]
MKNQHLRRLAAYYARQFPWYAELLRSDGNSSAADEPPYMTAQLLEQHYYSAPAPEEHFVYRTSGTSGGARKAIQYSHADERRYLQVKVRLFEQLAGNRPIKHALADMGTGHAAATALDVFRTLGWEAEAVAYNEPLAVHVERLTTVRPDLLYTMPSLLDRLVCALDNPAALGIQCIVTVGEPASAQWRRAMAASFGLSEADVIDTYGSIEVGTIAWFDHESGFYRLVDGIHAEVAEPASLGLYDSLAPNEGALVLTSTMRAAFPAIRFATGDVVRGFKSSGKDGSKATFEAIVRRIGPELKHGEKISIHDIEAAVFVHATRIQARAASDGNRLVVYLHGPDATPTAAQLIEEEIERKVPEIGDMIRGGMLPRIQIVLATSESELPQGSVKQKKWHRLTDSN